MTRSQSSNRRHSLVLLAVLLFGVAVRLIGIQWALPYHFHIDEDVMMYTSERLRTCESVQDLTDDIVFYIYSPLPLYWTTLGGTVFSAFHPMDDSDPESRIYLYTWARLLSVILGTATCLVVYFIGRSLHGNALGVLAALFVAVTPIHVRNSHFFTADIPFTFFATLVLWTSVELTHTPNHRWATLAGWCIGAAMLCKYTGIAFIPVLFLAQLLTLPRVRATMTTTRLRIVYFLLPPVTAGLLFFALDPWILFKPSQFMETYQLLQSLSSGAQVPLWTSQFSDIPRGFYWLTNLLPDGFGLPTLITAIIGLIFVFYHKKWRWIPVVLFALVYFLFVGLSFMQFIRYPLPLTPVISLAAAAGIVYTRDWAFKGKRRVLRPVFWAAVLLIIGFAAVRSIAYLSIFLEEDTRLTAGRWLQESYSRGTVVVTDNSAFRPAMGKELENMPMHTNLSLQGDPYYERQDHFVIRLLDVYNYLFQQDLSDSLKQTYINARLSGADLLVLSEESRTQYDHVRDNHPVMNQFYDDLFAGFLPFELVRTFVKRPTLGPFVWNDTDIELTWRLFDHPTIWIFERTRRDPG